MGLSVNDALDAIDKAKSIPEVRQIVSQVAADPENADVILYTGVSELAKRTAQERTGYSLIDDTDRAELLMNDRLLAKLGELAGMTEQGARERAQAISGANKLPDGHPDIPVVAQLQEMLFGKTGDAASLGNSLWGEASRDFVNAATGDVVLLLGRDAPRVFWGVELPALLANPGSRKINGVPVASLPKDPQEAYDAIKDSGKSAVTDYDPAQAVAGKTKAPAAGGGGGPPAARIGDNHVCPMITVLVPHVGGPIAIGCPTVLIGGMPAARVGDALVCVGPPDAIAMGSSSVLVGGMPQARIGDMTVHGGAIVMGHPQTLIGG